MSPRAFFPFSKFRAVRKRVAPVAFSARAVSIPMPDEQPVIRTTLSLSFPIKTSSLIISRAVGRLSPGPFGETQDAAYLGSMSAVLKPIEKMFKLEESIRSASSGRKVELS